MATSLLIIDDEPKMCNVLARMLARDGYAVDWTDSPPRAISLLDARSFDIILCDLRMPGLSGIDILEHAKRRNPATDFVIMTAYATPQTAVESMKKGAIDYLIKPFSIDELRTLIRRIEATRPPDDDDAPPAKPAPAASVAPAAPAPAAASVPLSPASEIPGLIAQSLPMQAVLARVRKIAASNASVLLRGESGTGKEVIARAIHRLSGRSAGPFIAVNCGAIPENLIESQLFGHVKGSFTGAVDNQTGLFEAAENGTTFLDEIGEIPPHLQVKLLRVLQENEIQRVGEATAHPINTRVIAATNRDLEADVAQGSFRQDLYYRLNVIPIILPPLRQRRDDIAPLIQHFLARYAPAGAPAPRISPAAQQLLLNYDYPGNIRELENAIEHAVVLCEDHEIHPQDLPPQVQNATASMDLPGSYASPQQPPSQLEQLEKATIMQALQLAQFNFTRTAQNLGITRRTLGYRIQKYGLEDEIARQKAK